MAIKFSELRGLMKDTNINTVKMSDPVYYSTMHYINHNSGSNSIYNNISFSELNKWKINDELYKITDFYPITYCIYFLIRTHQSIENASLMYKKQIWVKDFNDVRNGEQRHRTIQSNGLDLFNCYTTNDSNSMYKNLSLISVGCSHEENNKLVDVPIMSYKNGVWINEAYYKKVTRGDFLFNYYKDIIVYNDENIQSSVILYTNSFSFQGDGRLLFQYAYKGNDKIDKIYNKIVISKTIYNDKWFSISNKRLNMLLDKFYFGPGTSQYVSVQ